MLGPYPDEDVQGISVAVAMLVESMKPGRHYQAYTQFETMRKLCAAYFNMFHASARSNIDTITLGRDTAKSFLTTCPTQSSWFERFCNGCLKRMGQEVKQDLAVSVEVMFAFQYEMERDWQELQSTKHRIQLAMIGAYGLIAFGGSFRGHEVFLIDTFGLIKYASQRLVEKGQEYNMVPPARQVQGGKCREIPSYPARVSFGIGLGVRKVGLAFSRREKNAEAHSWTSKKRIPPLSNRMY